MKDSEAILSDARPPLLPTTTTTTTSASVQGLHYVYRNDPLQLTSYVGEMVEVSVVGGQRPPCRGFVYTVDPVTGSFVLCRNCVATGRLSVQIIPGPQIECVKRLSEKDTEASAAVRASVMTKFDHILNRQDIETSSTTTTTTMATTEARKKTVAAWLRMHFVPISDGTDDPMTLTIMNALTIMPPYGVDDCLGENEIILGKVQGLLKAMPDGWNENDFSQ